jgi:two-component system phosphate regulon sensor histidine kinase PhoR
MPPANSWLTITIQLPWMVALVCGLALGLLLVGLVLWLIRRKQRNELIVRNLETQVEELLRQKTAAADSLASTTIDERVYTQFIYNISHEISNPLQSIQTNLDNMTNCSPEDTARWKQYHAIIAAEIHRLSELTENLRLLSRLETPNTPIQREPVNIKGVIEGVIMAEAEITEAKGIRLVYSGPERPARVLGNRDHLKQVLLNLLDNSIKYSRPEGGDVVINVQEGDQRMLVRVIDEGIGISPEDLPYVFDTAYQAPRTGSLRRAGSGLGLAISKRIVEQHGGQLTIQSKPDQGTTVAFDLPLYIPS